MAQKESLDQRAKRIDAKWNIPRLAESQNATSYRAVVDFTQAVFSNAVLLFCAVFSSVCTVFTTYFLVVIGLPLPYAYLGLAFVLLIVLVMLALDSVGVWMPFSRLRARETHGSARRATVSDLVGRGLAVLRGAVSAAEVIIIGTFGAFHYFVNSIDQFSGHSIYVGPPRSGKTASFFIPHIRQFLQHGSTVALAIKNEIFFYSAHYAKLHFRIDLNNPEHSDRIPLMAECRNNPQRAGELCALLVSLDNSKSKGGGGDNGQFFVMAANHLGKSLILELANRIENPTPAHIVEFIGKHPRDVEVPGPTGKPIKVDLLDVAMRSSTNQTVKTSWEIFRRYDAKLQGGVIATLVTMLDQFSLPNIQVLFSAPTELDRKRGVKVVDFSKLREKGTAIYVCIEEGKDKEFAQVIATVFSYANNALKRTADAHAYTCPCLMSLDEASNIYLPFVRGGIGMGRGLGIFYELGIQGYEFLEEVYGPAAAAAIWVGTNNKYALPGVTGKAAKFFSEGAGPTTVLSRTSVDANSDANDSERASETGRPLADVSELRQMLVHTQAMAVITDVPAIFFAFPPTAKEVDDREYPLPHYNFELPPPLEESTPAPPTIDDKFFAGLRAAGALPAEDEEEPEIEAPGEDDGAPPPPFVAEQEQEAELTQGY
jgi:type IV secretory pathway TraG/TraD family ATPase VirD4